MPRSTTEYGRRSPRPALGHGPAWSGRSRWLTLALGFGCLAACNGSIVDISGFGPDGQSGAPGAAPGVGRNDSRRAWTR